MSAASPSAFEAVVRRRRMTRAFRPDPLEPALVDRLIDLARRAPAAGNTDGLRFVVLDRPADVAALWDLTLPPDRRAGFPWPMLLDAPVLVLPCVSPGAYVARYGEADKASRRAATPAARRALGEGVEAWSVPYWLVDGGMAVMTLLLGAEDAGLGALFFGLFEHEGAVAAALGVPAGWRVVGVVALGHPAAGRPATAVRLGPPGPTPARRRCSIGVVGRSDRVGPGRPARTARTAPGRAARCSARLAGRRPGGVPHEVADPPDQQIQLVGAPFEVGPGPAHRVGHRIGGVVALQRRPARGRGRGGSGSRPSPRPRPGGRWRRPDGGSPSA